MEIFPRYFDHHQPIGKQWSLLKPDTTYQPTETYNFPSREKLYETKAP